MKEITKLVLKHHVQKITAIFWLLSDLEIWCWIWKCVSLFYGFLFSIESIASDVALLSICSKRDLFPSSSGNAGPPTLSAARHHAGVTLCQPKGYLTWSMRAWVFGRSSRSGHSFVRGGIKRKKCRTRLGWQLRLRDGIAAQLLLYLQKWGWGKKKKWLKSIKKLTIPAFRGSWASLLTLPILLTQQSFCLASKTWGEASPPSQRPAWHYSLRELQ